VQDAGLKFSLEVGGFVPPGDTRLERVAEAVPGPGKSVLQGSIVRLKVWKVLGICAAQPPAVDGGRIVCGVPNVVGMDYHGAIPQLQKAGFKTKIESAGLVAQQDPRFGKVANTIPKAFEMAPKDSTIVVKVWALQGK
jgi:hypothetical protein